MSKLKDLVKATTSLDAGLPECEERLDIAVLIVLISNEKIFRIMNLFFVSAYSHRNELVPYLSIFRSERIEGRNILVTLGEGERKLSRRVLLSKQHICDSQAGRITQVPCLDNSWGLVSPGHSHGGALET